jgi:hypothetical protein
MKGIFMDTMTYAAFAAFRGYVAEKENQRPVYNPKRELMKVGVTSLAGAAIGGFLAAQRSPSKVENAG